LLFLNMPLARSRRITTLSWEKTQRTDIIFKNSAFSRHFSHLDSALTATIMELEGVLSPVER